MIKEDAPRIIVIEERSAKVFQDAVNDALEQYFREPGFRYEVLDPTADGVFRAYIHYSERRCIPETAEDRARLEGRHYTCWDCPMAEWPKDRRLKHGECPKCPYIAKDDHACEWLYQQIELGAIVPKGAE